MLLKVTADAAPAYTTDVLVSCRYSMLSGSLRRYKNCYSKVKPMRNNELYALGHTPHEDLNRSCWLLIWECRPNMLTCIFKNRRLYPSLYKSVGSLLTNLTRLTSRYWLYFRISLNAFINILKAIFVSQCKVFSAYSTVSNSCTVTATISHDIDLFFFVCNVLCTSYSSSHRNS